MNERRQNPEEGFECETERKVPRMGTNWEITMQPLKIYESCIKTEINKK
jgi:hypothetical protein